MRKTPLSTISFLIICLLIIPSGIVNAQGTTSSGPVYIVQAGDTLWELAYRFHVSPQALASANGISDIEEITIGQRLVIPGLEGLSGVLTKQTIRYGESLQSLSIRYGLSIEMLKRINHITSPNEIYAGISLFVLQNEEGIPLGKRVSAGAGQSLLELSILNDTDPWRMMLENGFLNSWEIMPGQVIRTAGDDDGGPGALPSAINDVSIQGLVQGQTAEIQVTAKENLVITGALMDHPLYFYTEDQNLYSALQGIYAMAAPGLHSLRIEGSLADGSTFSFMQPVVVRAGDFVYEMLAVDPATLDPETNKNENKLWSESAAPVTAEKLWSGSFGLPVEPVFGKCYPSQFGNRRSYNGSGYVYFHTGLDYCGQPGDPIYAAAPGVVVFTGELTVRGNATMIDHGRGVYTAYMHQSEILVNVGDQVEQGQLIGKVGNTGRVEGPHLHFEVIVGGVQVNPLDWLEQSYP